MKAILDEFIALGVIRVREELAPCPECGAMPWEHAADKVSTGPVKNPARVRCPTLTCNRGWQWQQRRVWPSRRVIDWRASALPLAATLGLSAALGSASWVFLAFGLGLY